MTRAQYEEYKDKLRFGRRGIVHEGRSAATVAELDWIAANVYGLDVTAAPSPKAGPKAEQPSEDTSQSEGGPDNTVKPKARSSKRAPSKPKAAKPRGATMEVSIDGKSVDVTKLALDGLREVATKLGIEPGNMTKGKLLDAIAKKAAA